MLSQLISDLQLKFEKHGDLKCFTNGEYGATETIRLDSNEIYVNSASLELDESHLHLELDVENLKSDDETILFIGGS
jgi:hypothetical protein